MSSLFGAPALRDELRRRCGIPEQVAGAELVVRGDGAPRGVRIVRVRSGEIEVDVVVDRSLDLAGASVRGIPVSWISPTDVAHPGLADPHGWGPFRTFFGGLLTTCGLDHTLGPAEESGAAFNYPGQTSRSHPLHGHVSATPARLTGYGIDWDADEPAVVVRGDVRQAEVFGAALTLEREIRVPLGGATVRVRDVVRNDGYAPTPHMILYHVNAGWPLLGPRARVVGALAEPRFATEAARGQDWRAVTQPARGVAEQVWEHVPLPAADGRGRAAVLNPDIGDGRSAGLEICFGLDSLPRLFQWRVMSETNYTVGLEPGNLEIEGRHSAEAGGRLTVLEPGETVRHELDIHLHHGDRVTEAFERFADAAATT